MKYLRIMYVSNGYSGHIRRRIDWMMKRGHDVHLISQSVAGMEGLKEYKLIPDKWNIGKLKYLGILLNYKRIVNEVNPDIVHISYMDALNMMPGLVNDRPLVLTGWGSDVCFGLSASTSKLMRYIMRRIIRKAKLITSVSGEIKETISLYTKNDQRVEVQRFGVDVSLFRQNKRTDELKRKQNISVDDNIIFCPRIAVPIYNHEAILRALPMITKKIKNIKIIMRSADVNDGKCQYDYFCSLRKLANELNVEKYIIYKSLLSVSDLVELYNVSDAVVSMSKTDGSPLSVLEAMSCETPVVCGDIKSLREIIKDGQNGYLVPVDDSEGLANVIIKLVKEKDSTEVMRKKGREFVLDHADFEKEMLNLERNYYKLLKC